MHTIDPQSWKQDLPAFREKTDEFYAGTLDKGAYKGFSGLYGSYAQKGGKASMLRLRMTAGRVTRDKLAFVAQAIRTYAVSRAHFTTCQSIQLHDLLPQALYPIMEQALDHGIVTMGGGGDFPRNTMCSPLSGVEVGEYFDVMPYAEAAGNYAMNFIKAEKMPRKILYYVQAMWQTFRAHGNYENRSKARTRYMQDVCGGPEGYARAYQEQLDAGFASGVGLDLHLTPAPVTKQGDGVAVAGPRVIPQKQPGLYAVAWHPIGGQPDLNTLCALSDALVDMNGTEMRLAPDETAYIINLTGTEAKKILALTADGAQTLFETSVSCIGGATCQVGMRDSQALLHACVDAVRKADIPDGALPQVHISGCPSSCGTHQTGVLGFRGASRLVDGKPQAGFLLFVGGNAHQGQETMGREVGVLLEKDVPAYLVDLGRTVAAAGQDFNAWFQANPNGPDAIAEKYL